MMEMFGKPLEEIRSQFTLSEQVLLGWRSQEQSYQMKKKFGENKKPKTKVNDDTVEVTGIPDKYYNEDGEVDHRKMTLEESIAYMDAIGIHMPRPVGKKPAVVRDKDKEKQPTMDDLFGS